MRPHRRPGLSLTEVLVALFVMALGLIALLTLFPLGAMQIGQALKDDRTAQTANQADAWVRAYWRNEVAAAYARQGPDALPLPETLSLALDDPNVESHNVAPAGGPPVPTTFFQAPSALVGAASLLPAGTNLGSAAVAGQTYTVPTVTSLLSVTIPDPTVGNAPDINLQRFVRVGSRLAVPSRPSYPVLIDPLGYLARRTALPLEKSWVGRNSVPAPTTGGVYGTAPGATPLLIPRRNVASMNTGNATADQNRAYATCALTDDLTYQANGGAGNGTEALNRQGRYTWAALIQRPDNSRPDVIDVTVLVFDGRPPFLASRGDEVVLTGNFVAADPANLRTLTLQVPTRGADQPSLVRRGGWIAVARIEAPAPPLPGVRQVTFHRVTGLTTGDETTIPQFLPNGTATAVTPVAVDLDPPIPADSVAANTQVYLLAGLSEVFTRARLFND